MRTKTEGSELTNQNDDPESVIAEDREADGRQQESDRLVRQFHRCFRQFPASTPNLRDEKVGFWIENCVILRNSNSVSPNKIETEQQESLGEEIPTSARRYRRRRPELEVEEG